MDSSEQARNKINGSSGPSMAPVPSLVDDILIYFEACVSEKQLLRYRAVSGDEAELSFNMSCLGPPLDNSA